MRDEMGGTGFLENENPPISSSPHLVAPVPFFSFCDGVGDLA